MIKLFKNKLINVIVDKIFSIGEDILRYLEEDVSGETITFQGIEYTFDSEENMVYDDELAEVGTWDGETIEFINATAAKLHRVRKLALKSD